MHYSAKVLIADDEAVARDVLRIRLEQEPGVEIVAECRDGREAVKQILALQPDVVFLDVEMPGLNGFEVLERIAAKSLPSVIFVTAYNHYAVRAFERDALDYILKPFDEERFQKAMGKLRSMTATGQEEVRERLIRLLEARAVEPATGPSAPGPTFLRRLAVRSKHRFVLVRVEEVDSLESSGNYVRIFARGGSYLLRSTLNVLERNLDPADFVRIHRTTIVNVNNIAEIQPGPHGDFDVLLNSGRQVRMSRGYRDRLLPGPANTR